MVGKIGEEVAQGHVRWKSCNLSYWRQEGISCLVERRGMKWVVVEMVHIPNSSCNKEMSVWSIPSPSQHLDLFRGASGGCRARWDLLRAWTLRKYGASLPQEGHRMWNSCKDLPWFSFPNHYFVVFLSDSEKEILVVWNAPLFESASLVCHLGSHMREAGRGRGSATGWRRQIVKLTLKI